MIILTCNIRCSGANDGDNDWIHRREYCINVIKSRNPDIICFQEMWEDQFADMRKAFSAFKCYGIPDEANGNRPMNCIFYKGDAFEYVCSAGYWLSTTPHVPSSQSWDSRCIRLANWIRLIDNKSGKEFRIINTHLDHRGQTAREQQAQVIVDDSLAYDDHYPQILTGDMNCDKTNQAIINFTNGGWEDSYQKIHGSNEPGFTFHSFEGSSFTSDIGKMDWVFTRGKVQTVAAEIIKDNQDGFYPSDHYFISAALELE